MDMAGRFAWLDRNETETISAYDKRINTLAAFHSGYAFLSYENYCPEFYAFAVYTVWNHEFNKKLLNPLPEGGFMMHCEHKRAEELCALGHGYPVFVKLLSKDAHLYVESLALADKDVVYDLYFNGCDVRKPEGVVFYGNEAPALLPMPGNTAMNLPKVQAGVRGSRRSGSSYIRGSYEKGSFLRGSFINGSFYRGAYGRGSYIGGSYIKGSYIGGLYRSTAGSYTYGLSGSYLKWFFGGGSYLKLLFGTGSYKNFFSGGSYRGFSFIGGSGGSYINSVFSRGSFVAGSFSNGSYSGRYFMTGSFYNGSYHRGSFIYGGFADVVISSGIPGDKEGVQKQDKPRSEEFVIRRLIEELGYGLDLI